MTPPRLVSWAARHEGAALAFLDRAPYENVFLTYVIRSDPFVLAHGSLYAVFDGERVCGVGYFGQQTVIAAEEAAIPVLARVGRTHHGERMIVGPRAQIARYWELMTPAHEPPRVVRERQFVMAVEPRTLRASGVGGVAVRHARVDEYRAVCESSAEMILGELGYDPRARNGDFEGGVRQMLARKLWWVGERDGELCFFCNIGPWSAHTVQLQGIWTPPALRGRGFAHAGLAAVCAHLFASVPTVSLYVNDFNAEAVRLYDRAGFAHVGELQTLLF